ncbi:PEP/pyruvate-binding domain-containing protein [Mycobacterium kiyosense]|uniref:PEP/pyruvate-binding domain-containing protein n=1 Tax=Mycobacterium kiyosense TaxID=2871094 RepID=UPI001EEDBD08|nr:PEP/pyruvate-binding domain-containing protein [Mycobacterium kiyosense]
MLWLDECTPEMAGAVGGKARGLYDLRALDLAVPDGFVVTTTAYRNAVVAAGLDTMLPEILAGTGDPAADRHASEEIASLFADMTLPGEVTTAIRAAWERLGTGPVAVRSSAIAEDREDASFAGQQETELWVVGCAAVERSIIRCWASLFTPQAIGYRARVGVAPEDVAIAVVVQRMVPAAAAGVAMTLEPVTGDRSQIYLESALGLGEGVVKGDVETDRFWIDKATGEISRCEIAAQSRAHRFDRLTSTVRLVELAPDEGSAPSISDEVARRIAQLGLRIEKAAGRPMDIEWAVDAYGEVHLVQGRPETVWSNRPDPPGAAEPHWRAISVTNFGSPPDATWSTTNAGEAVPGVQSPLGASIFEEHAELAFRETFKVIGALSPEEARYTPDRANRIIGFHFGRCALRVDLLCDWVDRIPGGNGEATAKDIFGYVPDGYVRRRQFRHYPRVLSRMWVPFVKYPRIVAGQRADARSYWSESLRTLPGLDADATRRLLAEAIPRTGRTIVDHTTLVFGAVQPAFEQLVKLAKSAGIDPQRLMAGHGGHEETEVLVDLWECAHDRMSLAQFIDRYGFHGPAEGDLLSVPWREDPAPVIRLIETYRSLREEDSPAAAARRRIADREAAERELIARVPAVKRPVARLLLKLARRYVPMRGIGKGAFVQNFDVIRAAARHLGDLLVADGVLDHRDDVFMLTANEIVSADSAGFRDAVTQRRVIHQIYTSMDVPAVWVGVPEPVVDQPVIDPAAETISGVAASPGVVEAPVRVALDPGTCEIVPGEILVARDTDPGWASLMFVSGGLVADIGGVMSHTAVVARELGIPCVVSTGHAVRMLRTGDVIRLDGGNGLIQIVRRVDPASA